MNERYNPFNYLDALYELTGEMYKKRGGKLDYRGSSKDKEKLLELGKNTLVEMQTNLFGITNDIQLKTYLSIASQKIKSFEQLYQSEKDSYAEKNNGEYPTMYKSIYFFRTKILLNNTKKLYSIDKKTTNEDLPVLDVVDKYCMSMFYLQRAYEALLKGDEFVFGDCIKLAFSKKSIPASLFIRKIEGEIVANKDGFPKGLRTLLARKLNLENSMFENLISETTDLEKKIYLDDLYNKEYITRGKTGMHFFYFSEYFRDNEKVCFTPSRFIDYFKRLIKRHNNIVLWFEPQNETERPNEVFETLTFKNISQKLMFLDKLEVLKAVSISAECNISSAKTARILTDILGEKNDDSVKRVLQFFTEKGREKDGDKNYPFSAENYSALLSNLEKLRLPNHVADIAQKLDKIYRKES